MASRRDLVLGYACTWWTPRASTWSYSSNRLRDALDAHARIVDIETQRSLHLRALEVAVGRLVRQPWQYSRLERALVDRRARAGAARLRPDAVIEIADVDTPLAVANFPFQDMSMALGVALRTAGTAQFVNVLPASPRRLDELARRSSERLRRASGVFAMSQWLADDMVAHGVPSERVRVVHAGLNSPPTACRNPLRPVEGRLLFVGADFFRKGGDVVVAAAEQLRVRGVNVRLTIAGPRTWPLTGSPPAWVEFLGEVPSTVLSGLWAQHDVFVMPSRFEAYGIVFVEALTAGLPCVAHNAFAMPELVRHGETGLLVEEVEPEAVADAIAAILARPAYFTAVADARPRLRARHDWNHVAAAMVDFIAKHLS
ncbi:MAG: glycosyltransferase family 4 protein [Jatrophihabitantaceae bacterium]